MSLLEQAKKDLAERQFDRCFLQVCSHWLENPDDREAVALLASLMKEIERPELATLLAKLAVDDDSLSKDAQTLFETAYALIDVQAHSLAVMLLKRCVELMPDEPMVNYELGFALMSLKQFAEASTYFERAASEGNNFDLVLNRSVCYTMTRDDKNASKMTDELSKLCENDDEKLQLSQQKLIVERLRQFDKSAKLGKREWYYILFGGILLLAADGEPGQNSADNQYEEIARNLSALARVLEGLKEQFAAVEYYNLNAKPLAVCLSDILKLPLESYQGDERSGRALLVMAGASDVVGPHKHFTAMNDKRTILSYWLPGDELLPIAPELAVTICQDYLLPWEAPPQDLTGYEAMPGASETEDLQKQEIESASATLTELAAKLKDSAPVKDTANAAIKFFAEKKDKLVLSNYNSYPKRPEYTAEIPS